MVLLEVGNLLSQSLFLSFCQQTPLHIAASKNYERTVECLVDEGADINIKDKDGVSTTHTTVGILYVIHVHTILSWASAQGRSQLKH